MDLTMVPVVCPCIAGVAADLLYVNTEQEFVPRDATAHDRSHIGLADAHDPGRDALPGVSAPEVIPLLTIHLRDEKCG